MVLMRCIAMGLKRFRLGPTHHTLREACHFRGGGFTTRVRSTTRQPRALECCENNACTFAIVLQFLVDNQRMRTMLFVRRLNVWFSCGASPRGSSVFRLGETFLAEEHVGPCTGVCRHVINHSALRRLARLGISPLLDFQEKHNRGGCDAHL